MDQRIGENGGISQPCFTFGIIADIQYLDKDDGCNYSRSRTRYYRQSLNLLKSAIEAWNTESILPSFILQLGDIIDGFNSQYKTSDASLETVLKETEKSKAPFHHVWGNHEFYNFSRDYLKNSQLSTKCLESKTIADVGTTLNGDLGYVDTEDFYAYHFSPFPKFRFIIIDTYDLSVLGRDTYTQKYQDSLKMLKEKNQNEDLHDSDHPEVQFVQFNGGLSQDQLNWLNRVLTYSDENQEKVVLAGHVPLHPEACNGICFAWNYTDVLSILHSHKCVVCYISGHDHDGGYWLDSHGIHHIILEGIIESPPGSHAFGTMHVFDDKMVLQGRGRTSSRVIHY